MTMAEYSPLHLQDYPFSTVRMDCIECDRQERHGKRELIAVHGPGVTILELKTLIVKCGRRPRPGRSCRAYFPDLIAG